MNYLSMRLLLGPVFLRNRLGLQLADAARVLANVAKRGLLKQGLRCPAQNTPTPGNKVGAAKVKLSAGTALSTDRLTYLARLR